MVFLWLPNLTYMDVYTQTEIYICEFVQCRGAPVEDRLTPDLWLGNYILLILMNKRLTKDDYPKILFLFCNKIIHKQCDALNLDKTDTHYLLPMIYLSILIGLVTRL